MNFFNLEPSSEVVIRLYAGSQPSEYTGSGEVLVGVLVLVVTKEKKINPRFRLRL